MKKLISVILVLAMLLSMGITTNAATVLQTELTSTCRAVYTFKNHTAGTNVTAITPEWAGNSGDYGFGPTSSGAMNISYGTDASSTITVQADPKDSTNMVLDINSVSPGTALSANQMAVCGTWQHNGAYELVDMDLYFTGDDRYQFVAVARGTNSSGSTWSGGVANVEFAVGSNASGAGFYANGTKVGTLVPKTGEWFNFKIIINNTTPGYDIYMDGVKINDATIACATGSFVTLGAYAQYQFGASKDYGSGGHMYIDNLNMAAIDNTQAITYDSAALSVPAFISSGDVLPLASEVYKGNTISWACSDADVSIDNSTGIVTVPKSCDGKTATFTATIANSTTSATKDFTVTLVGDEKGLGTDIHSYHTRMVEYSFADHTAAASVTAITPSYSSGDYGKNTIAYGSDASSTISVQADPADSTNMVLDINAVSPGTDLTSNQLATMTGWWHVGTHYVIGSRLKITGTDSYHFAITARMMVSGSSTWPVVTDVHIVPEGNSLEAGFYVDGAKIGTMVPKTDEWFDFKILINNSNGSYDIYIDDERANVSHIQTGKVFDLMRVISFGADKATGTGGHMYMDDLYMCRISDAASAAGYESAVLKLPKYISDGDTLPLVTEALQLAVTWSVDNANVAIDASTGVVTVPESEDGKTATFTAAFADGTTKQLTAVLNGYALNSRYTEDFEYYWHYGDSIAERYNWAVKDENRDAATTHSISSIKPSPDDALNGVLDVQVYGKDDSSAQLAQYRPDAQLSGEYSVLSADFKLADEPKNDYVMYIQGELTNNTDGSTRTANLTQLCFRTSGLYECIGTGVASETFTFPRNKWFNVSIVYNNASQTFDLYEDGVKINAEPIKLNGYTEGYSITGITLVQTGVPNYSWRASNWYTDNIQIASFDGRTAAGYDARGISVPANIKHGAVLATGGSVFGSTISWASSNEEVLSIADGAVSVTIPEADTDVTLTATITLDGQTVTKTYTTKVLNTLPFTVDSVAFTTQAGEESDLPSAYGTIKNVTVTKCTAQAYTTAKVIVAVYDGDSLVAVSQPTTVSASGTIDVNVAIGDGDKLYAKAYVWDMDNIAPLAYEFSTEN